MHHFHQNTKCQLHTQVKGCNHVTVRALDSHAKVISLIKFIEFASDLSLGDANYGIQ